MKESEILTSLEVIFDTAKEIKEKSDCNFDNTDADYLIDTAILLGTYWRKERELDEKLSSYSY
ncbi:hypothetical protein GC105_16350 [Alkalibaculum sp. M08DMB]|uniref:Uncharacterized protein n=2 Tax=Alkalibaculum sporogenes TaxID=2655001 RepID=A0A6A7KCT9_9FIRM|nr:hypothetical protein [Alkalibaculum sporogenes]